MWRLGCERWQSVIICELMWGLGCEGWQSVIIFELKWGPHVSVGKVLLSVSWNEGQGVSAGNVIICKLNLGPGCECPQSGMQQLRSFIMSEESQMHWGRALKSQAQHHGAGSPSGRLLHAKLCSHPKTSPEPNSAQSQYKNPSDETINWGPPCAKRRQKDHIHTQVKEPAVHVRVWWIMETPKYPSIH